MYGFDSVPSSLINDTPDPSSAKTTRLGAAPCNLDQSVGADGKAAQAMVINASANATEPARALKMLRSHKAAKIDAKPITIFRVTAVPNWFNKGKARQGASRHTAENVGHLQRPDSPADCVNVVLNCLL